MMYSCSDIESKKNNLYQASIQELTDQQYPDNFQIENRTELWNKYDHNLFQIVRNDSNHFTIKILPENSSSDTIILDHINILTWIPTIPNHIVSDKYLSQIGIVNAEWNRQQVSFYRDEFKIAGENEEHNNTFRIDLARNCLNSYAWEVITFTLDNGEYKPMYHGWFDFPKTLYRELFNEVNKGKLTFEEYVDYLENYKELEKNNINFEVLRTVNEEIIVPFEDHRMNGYPMTGARKLKYKNIVYPVNPLTINDMLTDSTTYSTFQWPGYYDKKDPRPTSLSKLGIAKKVIIRNTNSNNQANDPCFEFDITFARNTDTNYLTRIVIGGVRMEELVQMPIEDYNDAYKKPMGIGNHSFYEGFQYAMSNPVSKSPYYGFIIDNQGKWVDSHFFGVDGPILHLDDDDPSILHFWLLSFERHALVTHLTFSIDGI